MRQLPRGAGLLLAAAARAALAEAAPDSAEAPEAPAGLEEIQVRGLRTGVLRGDPTQSAERVELSDVEAEQKSVPDLLAGLTGVQVRRFGGAGERSEVSIRGATSAQVPVLLDGVRLDSVRSGSADLSTIPAELLESLEVQRGGGTAVGSGAIGGVVSLRSREFSGAPQTGVRAAGGSFGTWEGSAFRSERAGDLDLALGYAGFRSDGNYRFQRPVFRIGGVTTSFSPDHAQRINNESERHSLLGVARRELGPGLALRWLDAATWLSRGEPGLDSGSGATAGQRTDAHSRDLRNTAQLALLAGGEEGLSGLARLYHRYEHADFRDPIPLSAGADPIDVESDDSSLGGAGELRYARGRRDLWRALEGGAELRLESDSGSDRPARRRRVTGGWLRAELGLPGSDLALLVPSLRLDVTEDFGTRLLPGLGAVLEPFPWLRLRAHAERSFRAPSFEELYFPDQGFARGNPALGAERAALVDAGLELALAELGPLRELALSAGVFRHEIENSIAWFLVSPSTLQPQNTGKAREQGVELAASAGLTRWVALSANATWLDAEVDATGADLPGRTPLEISGRVLLGDPERLKLAFEVQYCGEIPVDEGGTQVLSDRTTLDASLALNLAAWAPLASRFRRAGHPEARLWVSLRGRNLSDVAVRDALFFPQPGRTFSLGLEGSF